MVSDNDKNQRRTRSVSDNELLHEFEYNRPSRKDNDDDEDDPAGSSSRTRQLSGGGVLVGDEGVGSVAGVRGTGLGAGGGRAPKQLAWTKRKRSARGLFFRSGSSHPKTQDGPSPGGVVGTTDRGSLGSAFTGVGTNLSAAGAEKFAGGKPESG